MPPETSSTASSDVKGVPSAMGVRMTPNGAKFSAVTVAAVSEWAGSVSVIFRPYTCQTS